MKLGVPSSPRRLVREARRAGVVAAWALLPVLARSAEATGAAVAARNWPAWRGPLGTGVAPLARPPLEWGEDSGKNIRWRAAIPGRGHSTPIVWEDRVFLSTAVPYGEALPPRYSTAPGTHDGIPVTRNHEFVVLALDRRDGKVLWQRTVRRALPHEGGHHTASLASSSPVTDGERLFVSFGSYGIYCLDKNGEVEWERSFGPMQTLHGHGEGSSPALHGDTLIVNWDQEGGSFVTALDAATGRDRWRIARDEVTSWATPIVVEHDGRQQVVISGTGRVRGYDLATGAVLWQCGGLSANVVASPVAGGGMVFVGSSYDKRALFAIRLDGAKGDITGTDRVAWSRSRGTPYVPSPLLYGEALYFIGHYQGVLTRVEARTGTDRPGATRLNAIGDVYASPVGAADRVYVTGLDGTTVVLRHGDDPQVLAVNRLEESVSASAAVAGREIFLRGESHLYCLAEP
jgi:outer membrane protein assembly factor BamB